MPDSLTLVRHRFAIVALALMALVLGATADAKITIRPHDRNDQFFFHGNYSSEPFDPATAFGIEIYNCPDGAMPAFIADRVPLIICGQDGAGGFALADRVHAVAVPGGTCDDHGRSCYYRSSGATFATGGVRYFRVQYARRGHGNRVWLETYGDLSAANQANMMLVITIDGRPHAVLEDTFTPLGNGGWFSRF